jgi:hypothetical protein
MLTKAEVAAWYQRLKFSDSTRTVIDHVRHSDAARMIGGGALVVFKNPTTMTVTPPLFPPQGTRRYMT